MKLALALPIVFVCSTAFGAKKATLNPPAPATPTTKKKPASTSSSSSPSSSALGNQSSTTFGSRLTTDDSSKVATGLRMMLIVPAWEGIVDRSGNNEDRKIDRASASSAIGLFVGAADIPVRRLGWLGGATVARTTFAQDHYTVLRGEMNLTWGFNRQVYAKWGANLHKFTQSPIDLDANIGLQVGTGLQLNRTLGAEASLVYMSQNGSKNGYTFETRETGIEIAITGTF